MTNQTEEHFEDHYSGNRGNGQADDGASYLPGSSIGAGQGANNYHFGGNSMSGYGGYGNKRGTTNGYRKSYQGSAYQKEEGGYSYSGVPR